MAAPATVFQVSVGDTATFVALSAGVVKTGVAGIATIVVKLSVAQALVPPTFVAFTRQKYLVLFERPLITFVPAVSVESCV